MKKIIYASDLDRTLIFSDRFLEEFPTEHEYVSAEIYNDRTVSHIDKEVKDKLFELNNNERVMFIPVTTRDIMRYNRVDLGFKPEYAIVSSGGIILHNGEPIEEWSDYVKSKFDNNEAMNIIMEIETEMSSANTDAHIIDGCCLMFKTNRPALYDKEVQGYMERHPNWEFTRQGNKCYIIPKHFSKQIALRWLWHKLGEPYIVASGDGELDLPMLTLANRAIIPDHSTLIKEGFVEECTKATGGIRSPLTTIDIVEKELAEQN